MPNPAVTRTLREKPRKAGYLHVRERMPNTPQRAEFWKEFICAKCQFPAPEKLRMQFAHATFSEFCDCGCNSFKVTVSGDVEPIASRGGFGSVFSTNFRLANEDKYIEVILFADEEGNLAYVEVNCCANSYPVPEVIEVQEPPFHVHTSVSLAL